MVGDLEKVFIISEDVVARDIQGEFILVPVVAGIGDLEDEIFSLNETGREIWKRLDGRKTLKGVTKDLSLAFEAPQEEIVQDVVGLVKELSKRRMLVEVK